jgi:O-antigen/teichoic acid export membrane protein
MLPKLARNTLVALGGTVALKALGFLTTLVLARGLGEDGFGIYSFVSVYMFFVGFFVDLGMERVVTRELAQPKARIGALLGNALILKLCLCVAAIPAAYVVASMMGISGEARTCIVIATLGLPLSIELIFRSYLQSQYQLQYVYAVTVPAGTTFLLLAALCVHWSLPVHYVYYALLLNGGLTLGLLLCITVPRVRPVLRPERELLRTLLRDAGEVGLFVLVFALAMRVDQILLFKLRGAADVGQYAVAVRVTEALSILPEALMLTVFPLLAANRISAPERFRQTYRMSFKYLSAVILPVALVFTVLRGQFVHLALGTPYAQSAMPLAILMWGMFFFYTGAVYVNLLIVEHQQRLLLAVSLVTLAVNIGVNLLLIPAYGATGAALATVISNLTGFVCWVLLPASAPFMAVCIAEALRPLLGVAVAWLMITALSLEGIWAVPVYVISMVLSGGFSRADAALVRELFRTAEPTESPQGVFFGGRRAKK